MSRTVHLHIGVAKSGTTFLQRLLFNNKEQLAKNGVLYPAARKADHFMASMDLRESDFQGHAYPRAAGAWDKLVREADGFSGTTVISHETLARSTRPHIAKAVSSFATDDVRIVITARDLARQIPAVWQERVKNRNIDRYSEFLDNILRSDQGRRQQGGFWAPQNVASLANRWAEQVGPERVTVVTVPRPGADKLELWRRFAAATDLPDLDYTFGGEGSNPSLGVVESEFLRRLNPKLADLTWPEYESRIKRGFAEKMLVSFSNSGRLAVPAEYHDEIRATSDKMIEALKQSGCAIVGDLEDLRPDLSVGDGPMPDEVDEATLLDLSLGLVGEFASRPPGKGGARPGHGVDAEGSVARRAAVKVRDRVRRLRSHG